MGCNQREIQHGGAYTAKVDPVEYGSEGIQNSNAALYPHHWHPITSAPLDGREIDLLTVFKRWPGDPTPMLCEDHGHWTKHNNGGWVHWIPGEVMWWRPRHGGDKK